jgi:hypothetical protein
MIGLATLLLVQDPQPDLPKLDRKVRAFVQMLRTAKGSPDAEVRDRASRILAEMERPTIKSREDVEAIILEIPDQEFTVRTLAENLAGQARVQIVLSDRIQHEGVDDEEPEFGALTNVSLSRLLDILCQRYRMTWTVKSGVIVLDLARPIDFGKVTVKFYDIRSLILTPASDGVRPTALVDMMAWGREGRIPQEGASPTVSSDDIVTLIMENVDPEVWEQSDLYQINMTPNQELLVSAPDETHKKIKTYLQWINRLANRQWEARVWIVTLANARASKLPEELSNVQWETLRRQAIEGKEAGLIGTMRLMGYPDQRVSCVSGLSHMIVRSYSADGQPQVDEITDGVKMWITAQPDDSNRVAAELLVSSSKVVSMEKISTKRGEVTLPELNHSELKVRRVFPVGVPIVLARLPGSTAGKPGEALVVVGVFTSFIPE